MNLVDQLTLLITANAEGAISVISGFTGTASAELGAVETEAAAAGTASGELFASGLTGGALAGFSALAGTVGALGAGFFAKSAISAAVDYNRATAAVNATLQATGEHSGATAGGIDRLASSLEKSQAIFAANVKQGAALLLTFTEVQNQPGTGNDIFNRALTTAAAVSNVFGKDITTSITQVGRALENPVAGMQALSRSGLTLDQADRARIINLAKQGDLLGAQKALLDAIQARGIIQQGEAIAKADPTQQFGVAFKEFKKAVGEDILPTFTELLKIATDIFGVFEKMPAPLRDVAEIAATAAALFIPILQLKSLFGAVNAIAKNTAPKDVTAAGAADLDAAGTKAGASISKGAADLTASGEKVAESGTAAAAKIEESASLVGNAGATVATDIEKGATALDESATVLFEQIDAGAAVLVNAGTIIAAKLAAVAEEQLAAQEALTAVGPVAVSQSSQTIAVDSAGEAIVVGINQAVAELTTGLEAAGAQLEADIAGLVDGVNAFSAKLDATATDIAASGAEAAAPIDAAAVAIAEAGVAAGASIAAGSRLSALGGLAGGAGAAGASGNLLEDVGAGVYGGAAVPEVAATPVAAGVSASLSTALLSVGAFYLSYKTTADFIGARHHTWQQLSTDAAGFANEIKHADTDNFFQKFANFGQAKSDFASANKGLIDILDTQGVKAAALAYNDFRLKLQAAGVSGTDLAARMHPFITALDDAARAEADAASGATDLTTAFGNLSQSLTGVKAELAVREDFLSLHAAQKQLSADQADFAGTGDKAKAAIQGVADAFATAHQQEQSTLDDQQSLKDAYVSLSDAQDQVVTSTHSLTEARAALALFDSPRGARERALAADILNRRVATTPAEEDQKQLDILKNQDQAGTERQRLQDAVTNALKSQRDAYKGVEDAQRGIIKATQRLHDDADTQKRDYEKIASAIANVRQVHSDAAAAIQADQLKVQEATIQTALDIGADTNEIDKFGKQWLTQITAIADAVAPGSDLAKNLHKVLDDYSTAINAAAAGAATINRSAGFGAVTTPPPVNAQSGLGSSGYPHPPNYTGDYSGAAHALGGVFFAQGGITESHMAQIAGPGTRVWAEPETGGEAYIPLADSKRSRSLDVLAQVADHFGMEIVGNASFADGGMTIPHYASGGLPGLPNAWNGSSRDRVARFEQRVTQENHFHGSTPAAADLDYANRQLGWRLSRAGRY